MLEVDVYERTGADTIERSTFYFVIGCILAWGFIATHVVSGMTAHWKPGLLEYLVVGLGIPILGIIMSISSSAFLSFIGFNLVVIPLGMILGPALAHYNLVKPGVVGEAASLTGAVAFVMAVSGFLFPNFYRSIGGMLFGALTALMVVLLVSLFIPSLASFSLIHYLAAGLFALYIGYDMWRASEIPSTMDNAVDVSISLYLDVINLFLWILEIYGDD